MLRWRALLLLLSLSLLLAACGAPSAAQVSSSAGATPTTAVMQPTYGVGAATIHAIAPYKVSGQIEVRIVGNRALRVQGKVNTEGLKLTWTAVSGTCRPWSQQGVQASAARSANLATAFGGRFSATSSSKGSALKSFNEMIAVGSNEPPYALVAIADGGSVVACVDVPLLGMLQFSTATPVAAATVTAPPPICPITKPPNPPFIPPPSSPPAPPTLYRSFWYGSNALWTMLPNSGITIGYNKSFWWRKGYQIETEPAPELTVTGKRLDGPAPPLVASSATNGVADAGPFMLVMIDVPRAGCWQITGHYHGHTLSYVAWVVRSGTDDSVVPNGGK